MTSGTQLQEFEETISNVASQQGNDSDSSYIDIDEVRDDDDVTSPADGTSSSKQPPKDTVKSSDKSMSISEYASLLLILSASIS